MICECGAGGAEEGDFNEREGGGCEGGDGDMAADVVVGSVGMHRVGNFSTGVVTREGDIDGSEGGRGEVAHGGGRAGDGGVELSEVGLSHQSLSNDFITRGCVNSDGEYQSSQS